MKTVERPYERLPGKGLRNSGWLSVSRVRNTLWLGEDHILSVDSNGYFEEYRRFYFRDIQGWVMQRTGRREKQMWVLGVLTVVLTAMAITFEQPWPMIFGAPAAVLMLFFLSTWLLGPTCVCFLQTAVHTENLAALNRVSKAQKFWNRVLPVIEGAQGILDRETLAAQVAGPGAVPQRELWKSSPAEAEGGRIYSGGIHWWLFGALLVGGVMALLDFWLTSVLLTMLIVLLFFMACILSLTGLALQRRTRFSRRLKVLTGVTLGFTAVTLLIGQGLYFAVAISQDPSMTNWTFLQELAELSPQESGWTLALFLYVICGSFGLGLLGMWWLKEQKPPPPAVPPPLRSGPSRVTHESA
jgi:hypothetical protein